MYKNSCRCRRCHLASRHDLDRDPARVPPPDPAPDGRLPLPARPDPGRHARARARSSRSAASATTCGCWSGPASSRPPRSSPRTAAPAGGASSRSRCPWSVDDFADDAAERMQARAAAAAQHRPPPRQARRRGCGSPSGPTRPGGTPRSAPTSLAIASPSRARARSRRRCGAVTREWRDAHRPRRRHASGARSSSSPTASPRARERRDDAAMTGTGSPSAGSGSRRLSNAGDALWTVALAWTAVHVASPGGRRPGGRRRHASRARWCCCSAGSWPTGASPGW